MEPIILKRITDKHGNVLLELSKIVIDNGFVAYWLTEHYPESDMVEIELTNGIVRSRKGAVKAFYDSYKEAKEDGLIEDSEILIYKFQKDLND